MKKQSLLIMILLVMAGNILYAQKKVENPSKRLPNIVFVLADDLGYGDLGCYGQEKIETPNIDALAKNGIKFTQHYAFPVCAPSRCMLFSGRNSGHSYIRDNNEWKKRGDVWDFKKVEANPLLEGQWPIPDSVVTIAEEVKLAGYTTALVGKWGLGGPMTQGQPNNQGFDYFYGLVDQRQEHTYYPAHLWENRYRIPLNNKLVIPHQVLSKDKDPYDPASYAQYQQFDYTPDLLIKAALNFIDKNRDSPFFLLFASPLVHVPLQAPQKWIDYYHKKFGEEEPYTARTRGLGYFPCRYPHATYAAMVSTLDEQVGMIVDKLKKMNIYKNTIIFFVSDNGPTYNGGSDSPWFDSGGPFKSEKGWGKGYLHEGGIRVPFIVSWPGKIKAGSKSSLISATWDAMPTICEIAGVPVPNSIDGISYLPTLLGKPNKQKRHPYLYWEFPSYGGQQAVRIGKWKGIRKGIRKGNMKIELFDLNKDIQELNDVSEDHPDIIKKMKQIMKAEHHMPPIRSDRMAALDG